MSELKFTEKISIVNGNPYVRPPDEVLAGIFKQAGKETSPIPVKGTLNGAPFTQTLVRYEGDWRLYINVFMGKAAKLPFSKSIIETVGQTVSISIAFDPQPPTVEMVDFLKEALEKNPQARTNWEKLIPSRKKEVLRYFSQLQSQEARARNLTQLLKALTEKEVRFMARTWKNGK